ncbi:MAG: hypothetical protein ACLQMF_09785 [Rectinemataceae bacterium]
MNENRTEVSTAGADPEKSDRRVRSNSPRRGVRALGILAMAGALLALSSCLIWNPHPWDHRPDDRRGPYGPSYQKPDDRHYSGSGYSDGSSNLLIQGRQG